MKWDGDNIVDPIDDMKNAIAKMNKPNKEYFDKMEKLEEMVQHAVTILFEFGYTPDEIEQELIKAGVWPIITNR